MNFTISLVMNEWLSVGSQWPICGVVTADFGDGHVRKIYSMFKIELTDWLF